MTKSKAQLAAELRLLKDENARLEMDSHQHQMEFKAKIDELTELVSRQRQEVETSRQAFERASAAQRESEKALAASSALLHSALESNSDGILVVDNKGNIVTYNQRFQEMWDLPDSIMEAKEDSGALECAQHQLKDPGGFLNKVHALNDKPETEDHDELLLKDGRVFHRYSRPYRLNGEIVGRVWSFLDISRRKHAEEMQSRRFEQLHAIYELSDLISRADTHEEICRKVLAGILQTLKASRAAISLFDKNEGMIFKKWKGLSKRYRSAVAGRSPWHNDVKDPRPVSIPDNEDPSLQPFRDAMAKEGISAQSFIPIMSGEQLLGMFTICYDSPHHFRDDQMQLAEAIANHVAMTLVRKQAAAALQKSEERYRVLYESNPTMYFTVDVDGVVVSVNEFGAAQLGYAVDELTGKSVLEIFHEEDRTAVSLQLQECLQRIGEVARWEFRKVCKNGDIMWVQEHARAIRYPESDIQVLIVCEDITDRMQLQAELARAQRLETAGFVAGQIAHDFNNLLSPLAAYPHLLHEKLQGDVDALTLLEEMEFAANQIAKINQQLLTLGRRGHYAVEPIDLNELARKVALSLALPNEIVIRQKFDPDLLLIEGGPAQLTQAIANLIINASEAIDNRGVITIVSENVYLDKPLVGYKTIKRGEYVKLTISDTGGGIEQQHIDKIFDPFFTTKRTDRRRGTGLGLSIVHSIIEDHKGYATVDSILNEGTSFSLYFPITRKKEINQIFEEATGGSESVLVVDDDPVQQKVVGHLLEHLGYSVHTVSSGEEAIEYLGQNGSDLVILDMVMDGMDGTETYQKILDFRPEQKAIISSGYAWSKRIEKVLQLGASEFIAKPVTLNTLAMAVRRVLDSK